MEITLLKYATAPVSGVVTFLQPGRTYTVPETFAKVLIQAGAARPAGEVTVIEVPAPAPAETGDVDEDAADEEVSVENHADDADSEVDGPPLQAAPTEEWRAYAEKAGIETKGLKKAEIIAAVRAA